MNKTILILKIFFLFLFFSISLNAKPLMLTQKEKEWLKENPILKVGVDSNFLPFEFVDEKGEFKGITADYLKEMQKYINIALNTKRKVDFNSAINNKNKIKFEIIKHKPWSEIISMAKTKELDVVSCIVETPERKKYLDFTSVYLSFPMVIVTNKATGFIHSLDELKGRSVAVIDNYTPNDILSKNEEFFLVKTKDLCKALELVSAGRTFAHVGNLSRVTYLLREKGFSNLTISGITDYKYNFSMAVKKGDKTLKNIIQKSFDAIPKEVKRAIYYKWFPLEYEDKKDYTLIWQILLGTLLLTIIFSIWVFKLNKNIKKRKVDKAQLLKDKSWLNHSLKVLNTSAWQWDLENKEIKISPEFARILNLGDKETIITEKYFKSLIKKDDLTELMLAMEDHFSRKTKTFTTMLNIKTEANFRKKILFKGEIDKIDIFSHARKLVGVIQVMED